MIRECSFEDISDGKRYCSNDMVRLDTGNCEGCHKCCTNVGNTIVLDPFDVIELRKGLGNSFQELLEKEYIELNLVDGLILPNIKMNMQNACSFLDEAGRCSIHKFRPGICRLFPLGRIYNDDHSFDYFVQAGECTKDLKVKLKIKKWLNIDNLNMYEKYVSEWHGLIKSVGELNIKLRDSGRGEYVNEIAMYILNSFYVSEIKDLEIDLFNYLIKKIDEAKKTISNIG